MLAKKYRLERKRVGQIMKYGVSQKMPLFIICSLKNDYSYPRFAVIVSGKLTKSAVTRNLFRRRTYEAIRRNFDAFANQQKDFALIGRKLLMEKKYGDIEEAIKKI